MWVCFGRAEERDFAIYSIHGILVIFIVYNAMIMMVICAYKIKGTLHLLFIIPRFYMFSLMNLYFLESEQYFKDYYKTLTRQKFWLFIFRDT